MPNYCENILAFHGDDKVVDRVISSLAVGDKLLSFNSLLPYPAEFREKDEEYEKLGANAFRKKYGKDGKDGYNSGGYEWCVYNWGTKWDAFDVIQKDNNFRFTTAWSPPENFVKQIHVKNPDVGITFHYKEPGMCFEGFTKYESQPEPTTVAYGLFKAGEPSVNNYWDGEAFHSRNPQYRAEERREDSMIEEPAMAKTDKKTDKALAVIDAKTKAEKIEEFKVFIRERLKASFDSLQKPASPTQAIELTKSEIVSKCVILVSEGLLEEDYANVLENELLEFKKNSPDPLDEAINILKKEVERVKKEHSEKGTIPTENNFYTPLVVGTLFNTNLWEENDAAENLLIDTFEKLVRGAQGSEEKALADFSDAEIAIFLNTNNIPHSRPEGHFKLLNQRMYFARTCEVLGVSSSLGDYSTQFTTDTVIDKIHASTTSKIGELAHQVLNDVKINTLSRKDRHVNEGLRYFFDMGLMPDDWKHEIQFSILRTSLRDQPLASSWGSHPKTVLQEIHFRNSFNGVSYTVKLDDVLSLLTNWYQVRKVWSNGNLDAHIFQAMTQGIVLPGLVTVIEKDLSNSMIAYFGACIFNMVKEYAWRRLS